MKKFSKFIIEIALRIIEGVVLVIVLCLALLLGIFDRIESLIKKL